MHAAIANDYYFLPSHPTFLRLYGYRHEEAEQDMLIRCWLAKAITGTRTSRVAVYRGTGQSCRAIMHAIVGVGSRHQQQVVQTTEAWEVQNHDQAGNYDNKSIGYTVAARYSGTMFPSQTRARRRRASTTNSDPTHLATFSWKPRHVTEEAPKYQMMSWPVDTHHRHCRHSFCFCFLLCPCVYCYYGRRVGHHDFFRIASTTARQRAASASIQPA
jgi:hypothetical protein